jgi:hypothetical protein
MRTLDETHRLLELLREAGDEPVSLDELTVVGLRDPARALLELELAGHHVHRVYETGRRGRLTCVRLAPDRQDATAPAPDRPDPVPAAPGGDVPAPAASTVPGAAPLAAAARRFTLAALAGALLVAALRVVRR